MRDALYTEYRLRRPLSLTVWCRKYTARHHHNTQTIAVPPTPRLHTFDVRQRLSTAITLSIFAALPIVPML